MKEITPLTGLRFLAAFFVLIFHLQLRGLLPDLTWRINNIVSQGAIGVNIFFILSGVVLTLGFATKNPQSIPVGNYMLKRLSKLGPVYWAGLLGALVVVLALRSVPTNLPLLAALNALYLNAWIPGKAMAWYGSGSWSLSCEILFYTLFCFILPSIIKVPQRGLAVLLIVTWIASAVPGLVHGLHPELGLFNWVYSFPPARVPEFVSGIIIALLVFRYGWKVPAWATVASILILLVYLAYFGKRMDGWVSHNWIATPLLGIFIAGLTQPTPVFRWLGSKPMVFLGKISYSFYIWQIVIMIALEILAKRHQLPGNQLVMSVLVINANLLLAYLSHRFVEDPAHKWINNRFIHRQPPSAYA